jgi:hypothetical protein
VLSTEGLTLFGPGSEWFWSMLQFVVVAITLVGIYVQLRQARAASAFNQAGALQEQWEAERMVRRRLAIAVALRDVDPTQTWRRSASRSRTSGRASGRSSGQSTRQHYVAIVVRWISGWRAEVAEMEAMRTMTLAQGQALPPQTVTVATATATASGSPGIEEPSPGTAAGRE